MVLVIILRWFNIAVLEKQLNLGVPDQAISSILFGKKTVQHQPFFSDGSRIKTKRKRSSIGQVKRKPTASAIK